MPSLRASPVLVALLLAGCGGLDRGTRDDTKNACDALCDLRAHGEGCAFAAGDCHQRCADDAMAFSEPCLLAAKDYYTCSAEVIWACPAAPDRPETEDARCAAEEHAWLVCKVTGEPPP